MNTLVIRRNSIAIVNNGEDKLFMFKDIDNKGYGIKLNNEGEWCLIKNVSNKLILSGKINKETRVLSKVIEGINNSQQLLKIKIK